MEEGDVILMLERLVRNTCWREHRDVATEWELPAGGGGAADGDDDDDEEACWSQQDAVAE